MLIRKRPGWALPESAATPERVFMNRRTLLKAAGLGVVGATAGLGAIGLGGFGERGGAMAETDDAAKVSTADLYPATRNPRYTVDRAFTDQKLNFTFNNFYEFGSHKRIYDAAQELPIRPWTVAIDGMVKEPKTWDIDALIRRIGIEERVYRLRCVEAWSMVAPWSGFPLAKLIEMVEPAGSARFVRFETFLNDDVASGQLQSWYPWPYIEGVTIEEAANELPFMVTGVYGKPLPKQMGAPLRLALPWKYGFKSIKSIVRITLTDERPLGFWEEIQGSEYGFWANVNPEVPHPRWSQATEEVLGEDRRIPTQLYNGYGEYVAHLYKGMEDQRATFM